MQQYIDPVDHTPLHAADDAELTRLRDALASGSATRADGGAAPTFDAAFLNEAGSIAYLVIDGIPNFIVEERIEFS